jgi:hypothetical protein
MLLHCLSLTAGKAVADPTKQLAAAIDQDSPKHGLRPTNINEIYLNTNFETINSILRSNGNYHNFNLSLLYIT